MSRQKESNNPEAVSFADREDIPPPPRQYATKCSLSHYKEEGLLLTQQELVALGRASHQVLKSDNNKRCSMFNGKCPKCGRCYLGLT